MLQLGSIFNHKIHAQSFYTFFFHYLLTLPGFIFLIFLIEMHTVLIKKIHRSNIGHIYSFQASYTNFLKLQSVVLVMWSILIYYLNSCCFLFAIQISHEKFLLFGGDSTRQHRLAKRESKYILVFSYDIECIYFKRNLFICGNFLWLKLRTGKLKGKACKFDG